MRESTPWTRRAREGCWLPEHLNLRRDGRAVEPFGSHTRRVNGRSVHIWQIDLKEAITRAPFGGGRARRFVAQVELSPQPAIGGVYPCRWSAGQSSGLACLPPERPPSSTRNCRRSLCTMRRSPRARQRRGRPDRPVAATPSFGRPLGPDRAHGAAGGGWRAAPCPSQCGCEVALMAPITRPIVSPTCRSGSNLHLQLDAMAGVDAGLDGEVGDRTLLADRRHHAARAGPVAVAASRRESSCRAAPSRTARTAGCRPGGIGTRRRPLQHERLRQDRRRCARARSRGAAAQCARRAPRSSSSDRV